MKPVECVVIFDKDEYHKKMVDILADSTKFKHLDYDAVKLTLKRETQVTNRILLVHVYVGILYGLLKIHKPSIPFRHILSCINYYS